MKNLQKQNLRWVFLSLILLAIASSFLVYGQNKSGLITQCPDSVRLEWWYPVLEQYDIELKDYYSLNTAYNTIFILGDEQQLNDTLLGYTDAVVLNTGKKFISIIKNCDGISYDMKNQILNMDYCSDIVLKTKNDRIVPFAENNPISISIDFNTNSTTSTTSSVK